MDGLCREFVTREILSPSDSTIFQRPHESQKNSSDSLVHPRTLNDAFSSLHSNSSTNGPLSTKHAPEISSIFSKSLGDTSHYFSRMDHDELPSRRYTKLEPDDLSYTDAVNPNDITRDRVRRKVPSPSLNGIIQEALNEKTTPIDIDFARMDHDSLSTNAHSPSFSIIESDNPLYSRFVDDDSNFTESMSGVPSASSTSFSSSHHTNGFDSGGRKVSELDGSYYRDGDSNLPAQTLYNESPPISGGVHGTSSDNTMDTSFMGDVSSSCEVPPWSTSLDQVC